MRESSTQSSYVGYLQLLRENRPFRLLWYGQFVSQLGDWFDSIALFALLLSLTGSGTAVGLLLVAQFLPPAIVGLWAGVVVDRLPRKTVMIVADLGRAVLVLLFLLIRSPEMIWLAYVVTAVKFMLGAFFEPARSAAIPSVVAEEGLVAANAISGVTWSAMLAIGAALGGLVVGLLGTTAAFLIDALSFLLSAYFVWRVPLPRRTSREHSTNTLDELREAASFLRADRDVALYTFTKGLWSAGGGVLLLLSLYGREFFPIGRDGALSIGLLYAARGLGTGVGPVVAQRWGGGSTRFLRRAIAPSFLITALGYAFYGSAPTLALAALAVIVAHTGGATQWVYSTALIQMRVPDRLLGRIFAVEFVGFTLMTSISSYLVGRAHDSGMDPRTLSIAMAAVFVLASAPLWALWRARGSDDTGHAEQVEITQDKEHDGVVKV
jgi:MFS family permease